MQLLLPSSQGQTSLRPLPSTPATMTCWWQDQRLCRGTEKQPTEDANGHRATGKPHTCTHTQFSSTSLACNFRQISLLSGPILYFLQCRAQSSPITLGLNKILHESNSPHVTIIPKLDLFYRVTKNITKTFFTLETIIKQWKRKRPKYHRGADLLGWSRGFSLVWSNIHQYRKASVT